MTRTLHRLAAFAIAISCAGCLDAGKSVFRDLPDHAGVETFAEGAQEDARDDAGPDPAPDPDHDAGTGDTGDPAAEGADPAADAADADGAVGEASIEPSAELPDEAPEAAEPPEGDAPAPDAAEADAPEIPPCLGDKDCADDNDCTVDTCDPLLGCVRPFAADGAACTVSGGCDGECASGACVVLDPETCDGADDVFTAGSQEEPAAATLADGTLLVVWASAGQDGSGLGVFGRLVTPD